MENIETVRSRLNRVKHIKFTQHFIERMAERPIHEALVLECLSKTEGLIYAEHQHSPNVGEEQLKLGFRLSKRYSLVVVAALLGDEMRVVTAWKTSSKWHIKQR